MKKTSSGTQKKRPFKSKGSLRAKRVPERKSHFTWDIPRSKREGGGPTKPKQKRPPQTAG